ncbi:MAG: class I SAM-dependent methyltransferase [Actinomycetota bacterium]
MTTIAELDRRYYPELVDEHVRFDGMIRRHLRPDAVVLDAGAGRGLRFPHDYEDSVARMAGVDRDPAVRENPNLTDAAVADLVDLPYGDAEFDVVFSKFVFEHLDRPITVMRELHRVLKPRGPPADPHAEPMALRDARRRAHPDPRPHLVPDEARMGRSRHLPDPVPGQ